jgi:carbon monoxide dehydrogenase subunit G
MATYVTTIATPRTSADAFDYMSDLRNFEAWDPGVRSVTQISGTGGGPDAEFDVVVDAPGGGLTLRYRTIEWDRPRSVTVKASSRMFTSLDRIVVEPNGDGSLVTYDATLTLNGPLKLLDPLLKPFFGRIGGRANRGLLRVLDGVQR